MAAHKPSCFTSTSVVSLFGLSGTRLISGLGGAMGLNATAHLAFGYKGGTPVGMQGNLRSKLRKSIRPERQSQGRRAGSEIQADDAVGEARPLFFLSPAT